MLKKLKIIIIAVLSIAVFTTVLIAQKPKTSNEHLFIETGTKYDKKGYDKHGFDQNGINRYTWKKYDYEGYDKDGYNKAGYSRLGYNREGQYERNHNEIARMAKLRREESSMDLERIEKNIIAKSTKELKENDDQKSFITHDKEIEEDEAER